jgi:hypothetical protein
MICTLTQQEKYTLTGFAAMERNPTNQMYDFSL